MNELLPVLFTLLFLAALAALSYLYGDWRHRRACSICRQLRVRDL